MCDRARHLRGVAKHFPLQIHGAIHRDLRHGSGAHPAHREGHVGASRAVRLVDVARTGRDCAGKRDADGGVGSTEGPSGADDLALRLGQVGLPRPRLPARRRRGELRDRAHLPSPRPSPRPSHMLARRPAVRVGWLARAPVAPGLALGHAGHAGDLHCKPRGAPLARPRGSGGARLF